MRIRTLGKANLKVSEVGIGTWQVGGKWGATFDDALADKILNTAYDRGVNFIDTADVYSDGLSEKAIGRFLKDHKDDVIVATKCGRQINPHRSKGYTTKVLRDYVEQSLSRLGIETIDLIQLHCPPTEVYYRDEIFELFDRLKEEGKIKNLGVSVEKVAEAEQALNYSNVTSVQIIFNMFRQKPAESFFKKAEEKNVGIIARVPLASGLLTGKFTRETTFTPDDHRNFNRNGEVFDKGETFSGVPFDQGLEAVSKLKETFADLFYLPHLALAWILKHTQVSVVIPGASSIEQVINNTKIEEYPVLYDLAMTKIKEVYNKNIREYVHNNW